MSLTIAGDVAASQVAALIHETGVTYKNLDLDTSHCALWARTADPRQGFDPFSYDFAGTTTRVRFFDRPAALGDLGQSLAAHWPQGAVGLALFYNEGLGSVGGSFVTTATQCPRSPWAQAFGRDWCWMSFGGTMFQNGDFLTTLTAHMDKSQAMDPKGRFIDLSLRKVGKPDTRLGASKSCFKMVRPSDVARREDIIRNYAWFQRFLGINITGGDQGFGKDENDIAIAVAPENFCNSPLTGGYDPTSNTAPGIILGLERLVALEDAGKLPLIVQGVGGIGSMVVQNFLRGGHEVFASDSAFNPAIVELFRSRPRNFVLDIAGRTRESFVPTKAEEALGIKTYVDFLAFASQHGWRVRQGLEQCLGLFPLAEIFSPCAGVHPLTDGVRRAIIASNIRIISGPANNVHGIGPDGTYLRSAWELQDAKRFVDNDSRLNRGGATGVVGGISELTPEDMTRQAVAIADDHVEAYHRSRETGVPPQIEGDRTALALSHENIDLGITVGAKLALPPETRPVF